MNLVVRVDGGPSIGYGHLVRSMAVVEELLEDGHSVTVATTNVQPVRTIFPTEIDIVELPSRDDFEPFVNWVETNTPDIVFTDAYPIDTEYQRAVRNRVPLAVLQDDNRHAICADLFVNGNLYAKDIDYRFIGQQPKTCLGTDFVPIRRDIIECLGNTTWRDCPERALITMGGSDIASLTPSVMRIFQGLDIHVDTVVGPGVSTEHECDIRRVARRSSVDISVHRNPINLAKLMAKADFAVSTASSTVYELLALGTPMVCIIAADNQELIGGALRNRPAATVIESKNNVDAIASAIRDYVENAGLRWKRRTYGRSLVDGRGAQRIAALIVRMVDS